MGLVLLKAASIKDRKSFFTLINTNDKNDKILDILKAIKKTILLYNTNEIPLKINFTKLIKTVRPHRVIRTTRQTVRQWEWQQIQQKNNYREQHKSIKVYAVKIVFEICPMLITKFYLISKASQELWKAVVYLNELFKLTTSLQNSWWALKLHKTVNNNIGLVRLSPWYEPKIGRGTAE